MFSRKTQAIIYGMQDKAVQRMLDFDYVCSRDTPSVAAIVNPGEESFHKAFFGAAEILIPVYPSLNDAVSNHPNADVMINFASFRSAYKTSLEALETNTLKTVVIIAEGVPERRTRELIAIAKNKNKMIIGPATVGGITAGAFKIGDTAGTVENIIESKLHRPGCVGFVSKSGGMSNEMYNIIARNTNGLYEGIAIGGDKYPGSTLLDHILRYEKDPAVKMIVCLGELGGDDEYEIVDALKVKKIKKPLVMWVTGTCSKVFPGSVQFGHAGAKADSEKETAQVKNNALKEAGAIVPKSFDDFGEKIKETYERLKDKGIAVAVEPRQIPARKETHFISTISDERGEELEYNGIPISEIIEKGYCLGDIIGLLWFRKKLPKYATKFIENVLIIVAEHGPAVSGAHNAIVAARAGKDIISSLASGLLTIGPRFGGAIDGAANYFKSAFDRKLTPQQFVDEMKAKNIKIPGIGHAVKSITNPDKRVELLKDYAKKNFPKTELLDYALEVEKLTTKKKGNLILNVDGCVGVLFVDLLSNCKEFSKKEIQDIIQMGFLNGFFALGRSIGILGHIIDQYRLKQPLYRHPWDDILYLK